MTILALEFSTERRSVAVVDAAEAARPQVRASAQSSDRAVGGLRLVEQALAEAGVSLADIGAVAVGLGPGSYTGIRVALAMAQGWQLARGVETRGVYSATCVAHQAAARGGRGRVAVVSDAQRGEFHLGLWRVAEDGAVTELEPLRIVSRAEVLAAREAGAQLAGCGLPAEFAPVLDLAPDAAMAGVLAATVAPLPVEQLEPVYLRVANFVKAPPPRVIP
jgi:tRNA threonylcarbamoyladenosine biosynthesis protein TsaB